LRRVDACRSAGPQTESLSKDCSGRARGGDIPALEQRQFLQYTTTSPIMHKHMGVDGKSD